LYLPPGLSQNIKKKFKIKKYTVENDEFEKQQDREISEKMRALGLHPQGESKIYKKNFPRLEDKLLQQQQKRLTSTTTTFRAKTGKLKKGCA
jgi:hypothetical protein